MKALATSLLVLACLAAGPRSAAADGACIDCHSMLREPSRRAPALSLLHSVHRAEGLACTTCHGGEDRPSVRAHALGTGFAANPVGACISCHIGPEERAWWEEQRAARHRPADAGADAEVATPSADAGVGLGDAGPSAAPGSGVGDLAEVRISSLYLTSGHASSYLAGTGGATCGDCHQPHGAIAAADPASSVHWTSIPATCARCHHDPAGAGGRLEDPVKRWARSVHGAAWGERVGGDDEARHGPGCADCHDPHGNRSGEEALEACINCHEEVRGAFDEGPHAEAFERRGFLDCVGCHGSHEILAADASLITAGRESACRRCHGPDQEVYEQIGALGVALEGADEARRRIAHGDDGLRAEAAAATAALVVAVHSLALEDVETHAATLAEIAARAPEAPPEGSGEAVAWTGAADSGRARVIIVAAVAVVIGLFFTMAWRRRRSGR